MPMPGGWTDPSADIGVSRAAFVRGQGHDGAGARRQRDCRQTNSRNLSSSQLNQASLRMAVVSDSVTTVFPAVNGTPYRFRKICIEWVGCSTTALAVRSIAS